MYQTQLVTEKGHIMNRIKSFRSIHFETSSCCLTLPCPQLDRDQGIERGQVNAWEKLYWQWPRKWTLIPDPGQTSSQKAGSTLKEILVFSYLLPTGDLAAIPTLLSFIMGGCWAHLRMKAWVHAWLLNERCAVTVATPIVHHCKPQ